MPTDMPSGDLKPHYPVLVIGAGINGCGLFRDLCLQGVDCLLIDRGDICQGASAAPSRLIHGGIKYLETGEFRLVRESAMERNRLLRNAPHYVKPIETVLPVRSWFGGIAASAMRFVGLDASFADRGALIIELGLRIYDFYNRKIRALPDHTFFGPRRVRSEYPDFDRGIIAAGVYSEGRITHAERLCLELAMDGLAAHPGSDVRTYTAVADQAKPGEIILLDQITGATVAVSADVIVNAGGAWIDKVNAGLGIKSQHMGGSQGSHLIIDNRELVAALKGRMIYFGSADGRVNLVYPFFGNALVGSTDIPVADPDAAGCSDAEVDYLIGTMAEIFPGIAVARDQILLTYCGVRPLPRTAGVAVGSVSRDHAIATDILPGTGVPVFSLIGGKWTTFRAFSEQAADLVLARLGKARARSTEDLAIGGGRDYPAGNAGEDSFVQNLAVSHQLDRERARTLFARYGTSAAAVASFAATVRDAPLVSLPGYSSGELAYICSRERVRRLADLLLRRTSIAMEGLLGDRVIEEVGRIVAAALGWDAERSAREQEFASAAFRRRAVAGPSAGREPAPGSFAMEGKSP